MLREKKKRVNSGRRFCSAAAITCFTRCFATLFLILIELTLSGCGGKPESPQSFTESPVPVSNNSSIPTPSETSTPASSKDSIPVSSEISVSSKGSIPASSEISTPVSSKNSIPTSSELSILSSTSSKGSMPASSSDALARLINTTTYIQSGTVGAALPSPITVSALGTSEKPIANVVVKFTVTEGGGHVSSTGVTTGPDGTASTIWTLGTTATTQNKLTASVDGTSVTTTIIATSIAGSAVAIEKVSGDNTSAPPGYGYYAYPVVTVRDAYGNPSAGAQLTYKVMSGDGVVDCNDTSSFATVYKVTTGSSGSASCRWRRGNDYVTNTLEVELKGVASVTFTALTPNIVTSIVTPSAPSGQKPIIGNTGKIVGTAISRFQLASVVATIGNSSTALLPANISVAPYYGYSGSLIMPEQSPANVSIALRATDIFGTISETTLDAQFDREPVLTASVGILATPKTQVTVTCSDDDKTVNPTIQILVANSVLVSGSKEIFQEISLAALEGQLVNLQFNCLDSIGNTSSVTKQVYVSSSNKFNLKPIAEMDGDILDISGVRVLQKTADGIQITDLTTGSIQTVNSNATSTIGRAYLTPLGAIYLIGDGSSSEAQPLYDWNGTTTTDLDSQNELHTSGNFAAFVLTNTASTSYLYGIVTRRNLVQQSNVVISNTATTVTGNQLIDLNSIGTVAFTEGYNIYQYKNDVKAPLTSDGGANLYRNYSPRMDGDKTLYVKSDLVGSRWLNHLAKINENSEAIIYPDLTWTLGSSIYSHYMVSNGFVGFTQTSTDGTNQIFRLDLANNVEKVSYFNSSSTLDLITPDGTIFFHNDQLKKIYRVTFGMRIVEEIGSTPGNVIYRDGRSIVIMGRLAFEVQ
jgi:hypothetical protein